MASANVPAALSVATARAVSVLALTPVEIELCPVKLNSDPSALLATYRVLPAEPLNRNFPFTLDLRWRAA